VIVSEHRPSTASRWRCIGQRCQTRDYYSNVTELRTIGRGGGSGASTEGRRSLEVVSSASMGVVRQLERVAVPEVLLDKHFFNEPLSSS